MLVNQAIRNNPIIGDPEMIKDWLEKNGLGICEHYKIESVKGPDLYLVSNGFRHYSPTDGDRLSIISITDEGVGYELPSSLATIVKIFNLLVGEFQSVKGKLALCCKNNGNTATNEDIRYAREDFISERFSSPVYEGRSGGYMVFDTWKGYSLKWDGDLNYSSMVEAFGDILADHSDEFLADLNFVFSQVSDFRNCDFSYDDDEEFDLEIPRDSDFGTEED